MAAAAAPYCLLTWPLLPLLVLVLAAVAPASGLQLPDYIKACSRNDPDLNACAYKSALEAIPNILKGDRQYNVPPLTPLKVSQLKVSGGEGSVGLDITFTDASFHGFSEAVVKETSFDLANNKAEIKASVPAGQLLGQYQVDGRVLLLPIRGSGDANITLTDLEVDITVQWELETKDDGKEYIKPVDSDIKYEMSRAYMHLDNLFDGDKVLGGDGEGRTYPTSRHERQLLSSEEEAGCISCSMNVRQHEPAAERELAGGGARPGPRRGRGALPGGHAGAVRHRGPRPLRRGLPRERLGHHTTDCLTLLYPSCTHTVM